MSHKHTGAMCSPNVSKPALVLHGDQLLIPLSFIPASLRLPAATLNYLSAFLDAKSLRDKITERTLSAD